MTMTKTPETPTSFSGSIPQDYDRYLGPLLFDFYADDLARCIEVPGGGRVLETACGTGIVTERIRQVLADDASIVATDVNPAMLAFAEERRGNLADVQFAEADAGDLPYADNSFDAIACQFGWMFFPDPRRAMREAARVLRNNGQIAFSLWDSVEHNPIAAVAQRTIVRYFDEEPPQFLDIPFSHYALDPVREMLDSAGFCDISMRLVPHTVELPSARDAARGLVQGNPTITEIRDRANASSEEIVDAVTESIADLFGDAPMRTSLRAIVTTARLTH